jgi:hypothetical protein
LAVALASVMAVCCTASLSVCFGLPSNRAYEMVSPVFKGGFGAGRVEGVTPGGAGVADGDAVAFYSAGAFAGAPAGVKLLDYLSRREADGWHTTPLMAPLSVLASTKVADLTPSMDLELVFGQSGENSESGGFEEEIFFHSTALPDIAAYWEHAGRLEAVDKKEVSVVYETATTDFCHVVFATESYLSSLAVNAGLQLYEYDRGCKGEEAALRLVGLNNKSPAKLFDSGCVVDFGTTSHYAVGGESSYNALSADGGEVFFTSCVNGVTGPSAPHQVFVRLGGKRTVEISRPLNTSQPFGGCALNKVKGEVPCEGAAERPSSDFVGASEDGSRVFFTTAAPLVASDKDGAVDLYMAGIGCPEEKVACGPAEKEVRSLTQESAGPNGQAAEVQGVVRVAPDGSRVYFVARGDLLAASQYEAPASDGRPVPTVGADNLYVRDVESGATKFIGELCSGPQSSGATENPRCPNRTAPLGEPPRTDSTLWSGHRGAPGEAQTAGPDGRFLVFATYGQLTPDDADDAKDVYRYEAATGSLERISVGEEGYDADGNRNDGGEPARYVNGEPVEGTESNSDATILPGHVGGVVLAQHEMDNRATTEDGSRIVFSTSEPLSSRASNGLANVYEWHDSSAEGEQGQVSLISGGDAEAGVHEAIISPSGLSIVFPTVQGLVPQDVDGASDVYDARMEGGFAQPPMPRNPCNGDACQGPLASPAPVLVPGSSYQGSESPPKKQKNHHARKAHKRHRHKHEHKHRGARKRGATHVRRGRTAR